MHFRTSGANLVCNGSVPASATPYTPMVIATPTNTAIAAKSQVVTVTVQSTIATGCTPTGSPCPVGATAPTGFHFNLVAQDDFTQDTDVNLSSWDCGSGGTSCLAKYPGLYAFDSRGFIFDTTVSDPNCEPNQTPGCITGIGSAPALMQKYGFWEWSIKHPTDVSGEGDGYHVDTYINNNGDPGRPGYQEVDLDEIVLGTGNQSIYQWTADATAQYYDAGVSLGGDFHIYGTMWVNDTNPNGDNGTTYGYFDGSTVWGPLPFAIRSVWGNLGAVIIMGSMRNCLGSGQYVFNGNPRGPNTVVHGNPYIVKYFRLWQIVPD